MTQPRQTINELKRTIALLQNSTAPRAKETIAACRANIKWLRQVEREKQRW